MEGMTKEQKNESSTFRDYRSCRLVYRGDKLKPGN